MTDLRFIFVRVCACACVCVRVCVCLGRRRRELGPLEFDKVCRPHLSVCYRRSYVFVPQASIAVVPLYFLVVIEAELQSSSARHY